MNTRLALLFFGWGALPAAWPPNVRVQTAAPDAQGNAFNPETLGRRLDRAEQIPLNTATTGRRQRAPYEAKDFNSCVGARCAVALENLNPMQPANWPRAVSIDFVGFSPQIKCISNAQKQQLMAGGRRGVQAFLTSC